MPLSAFRLFARPLIRLSRTPRIITSSTTAICHRRSLFIDPWSTKAGPSQEEKAKEVMNVLRQSDYWKQIVRYPEAIKAFEDIIHILIHNGFDFGPTPKQPSLRSMLSLAASSEFREALPRLKKELKRAGVDMDSEDFMKMVAKSMAQDAPPSFRSPWLETEK